MIPIRSMAEIDAIARAGAAVAGVLERLIGGVAPGVTTAGLDAQARELVAAAGAIPLFPGFESRDRAAVPPFPGVICTSVNDEVAHGVPGARVLRAGDVVSIDLGASVEGWCADASRAVVVPSAEPASRVDGRDRLVLAARQASDAGLAAIAPGVRWSSVADTIRSVAQAAGFRVVAGFSGHGIGRALHEPPRAAMFLGPREDFVLRPGMVLTVEPILVGGAPGSVPGGGVALVTRADGWTVATADGSDACQIEETVAVTRGGVRVLTAGNRVSKALESGPPVRPV